MSRSSIDESEISHFRRALIRFLDRAVELGLLLGILSLPLAFPRFLIFLPLKTSFIGSLVPQTLLLSYTPLNLKEALAAFIATWVIAVWLVRSLVAGRLEFVWTPLHAPFLVIIGVAGLTFLRPLAWRLQLRDFALLIGYLGLLNLFLLQGFRLRFRRKALRLFLWVAALFTAIVFAMDRDWYFEPFVKEVTENRRSLYATIGHNISVASLLMLILVYTLGGVAEARRWWKRILFALWAVLALNLIVATQTVGVWLALVLLVPVSGLVFWQGFIRRRAARCGAGASRWVMITVGFLVLAFVGLFMLNEFLGRGRAGSSPMDRLRMRTNPQILQTGTRARLWTISMFLVRERFPAGVGFSGFKYLYPKEQGRYFREHPDSVLFPTDKHTDRVHNEYLQLWVELGAAGLLALLWALGVLVSLQWRVLRSARLPVWRRFRATVAFLAIAATLFHLLTSFELHVASTAYLFLLGFCLWIGEGQLGRRVEVSIRNLSRWPAVAAVLSLFVVVSAVCLQGMVCRHVMADALFWLGEYWRVEKQDRRRAAAYFQRSFQLAPYRGQVGYHLSQTLFKIGEEHLLRNEKDQALKMLAQAEKVLNQSLQTYQFKDMYFNRANIRKWLGTLTHRREFLDQAIQDYRKAIEIYPYDLTPYYEMGKLFYGNGQANRAVEVWKEAQHYNFNFMRDFHVKDAEYMLEMGQTDLAIEYYSIAIMLNPDGWEYYEPLFDLYKGKERYAEALNLARAYLDLHPDALPPLIRLVEFETWSGNPQEASKWLEHMLRLEPLDRHVVLSAHYCLMLLDRDEEAERLLVEWIRQRDQQDYDRDLFYVVGMLNRTYAERGMFQQREALWTQVLERPSERLPEYYRNRALLQLGNCLIEQGRQAEAVGCFLQAAQIPIVKNQYSRNASLETLALFELPLLF